MCKSNILHINNCYQYSQYPKSRGFTVVELIVTITILTIIGILAFPAFIELITQERIKGDAYRIYSSMQHSQEIALHSGRPVAIIPIGDFEAPDPAIYQSWSNHEAMEPVLNYWVGNKIVTGFIPEEIYYGNYHLSHNTEQNINLTTARRYISDIKAAWKNDPSLLIKQEKWITFANLDSLNKSKNVGYEGIRRLFISSTPQNDFTLIHGAMLLFDPSGYASSTLTFSFTTEFNFINDRFPRRQEVLAKAGFCLANIRTSDSNIVRDALNNKSNFMPFYAAYRNIPFNDKSFGIFEHSYCKEVYR